MQEYRIDLHTHSSISYDGGITAEAYRAALRRDDGLCVAITDHHQISLAAELAIEFPGRVIVGEEIRTREGEIIGLYLREKIEQGLSMQETIKQIKNQNALVYVPHPLEKTRSGVSLETLQQIIRDVDIVESFNARTREPWLQDKIRQWVGNNRIAAAASSDSHGSKSLACAHAVIHELPTRETLVPLLKAGRLVCCRAPLLSFFDPLKNKIKKLFV